MARSTRVHTALLATVTVVAMSVGANAAPKEVRPKAPAGAPVVDLVSSDTNSVPVRLGVGKSVVIDLPRDIKDVLVADPSVANAVVRTARRTYLIGQKIGQTSIVFFDADGRQIASFDVAVKRDLNGIEAALRRALPDAGISVEGLGENGILLAGSVATQEEAQLAYNLACSLITKRGGTVTSGNSQASGGNTNSSSTTTRDPGGCTPDAVVNRIVVRGRDQVMLKVTVAEVQRDVVKQLGVDVNGSFSYGTAVVNFNTDNPFSINQQPISGTAISAQGAINPLTGMPRIGATIRAMERAGIVRLLAEPTLTAISGESATFLAGGEFPFPIPQAGTPPTIGIEFKQFGVSLTFTPVVLSEGRISMKVLTEVSELSSEGGVTVLGTTVPSLRVRRADTTLEIPSGGTLGMAGMIREQTRQAINGLPGLMQIPVLGTLFKSRDFVNNQTELMVLVTPYIVRAVAQKDLSRPDDGYADASDPASNFLARLNRIYGVPARRPEPVGGWRASFGFILD